MMKCCLMSLMICAVISEASTWQMKVVSQCPRNELEWHIRSETFNCEKDYYYHCAVDENGCHLVELCAPVEDITGQSCAEFNTHGHTMTKSRSVECSRGPFPCPWSYKSNESYKYQTCYDFVYSNTGICPAAYPSDAGSKTKVENKQNNREQNHERNRAKTYERKHEPNIVNNHYYGNVNSFDYIIILGVIVFIIVCISIGGYAIYRYLKKKKNLQRDPFQIPLQNVGTDDVEADP